MSSLSQSLPPIFLIDDDADDLFLIHRRLGLAGLRNPVITFRSSEEAVAHFEQLARATNGEAAVFPRVVFLDIKMPQLDGFDVLRQIRKEPGFAGVTVAMLSGSDEPRDKELAMRLGANHYLVKFPDPEILAGIVHAATNGSDART